MSNRRMEPWISADRIVEEHLAASARAMKRILASKESARRALIEAGIMDKSGNGLAEPYRSPEQKVPAETKSRQPKKLKMSKKKA